MNTSLKWIKALVPGLDCGVQEYVDAMTLSGSKVEGYEPVSYTHLARYLNSSDPKELATHCMEDIDKDFVKNVHVGDIIVANKNFGCGSSREHAPISIKASGVSCVIAETFARIFYRNAINIGLPIIECPQAAKEIQAGDEVEVDFDSGIITDAVSYTHL